MNTTTTHRVMARATALAAGLLAATGANFAQTKPLDQETIPMVYDSGIGNNTGSQPEVVISFPIYATGAPWMRLFFSDVQLSGDPALGTGSILRITSLLDGAQQRMNALHVSQWENSSAYFNGDALLVEVLAFPGTGDNRVQLESLNVGILSVEESQCGSQDNRVPSSDARAGRLLSVGCTGWLINDSEGCMLTAGHCGPSGSNVLQFNVPDSSSNGSLNNPPPQDQYSVDPASIQSNGGGTGIGDDYSYFGCFPNSNTGLTALEAQGSSFTIVNPPAFQNGQTIRITGFGVDFNDNTRNQTQQTHSGPRVSTPQATEVEYMVDTEGGNSGSPVIFESTGDAIGIHTHGGCSGSAGNHGTGINHSGLQNALANPQGVCSLVPNASFSGTPVSGQAPLTVAFLNTSTGDVTSTVWSFGDGGSSTQSNPSYTYVNPGTFTVSLTASGANGSDTETKTAYIVVDAPPVGDATCVTFNGSGTNPTVFTCSNDPIIGQTWTSTMDGTSLGASGLVFVFGYNDELIPGLPLNAGELLLDISSPFGLFAVGIVSNGIGTINQSVPNDPSLVAFVIHTQGFFNNAGGSGLLTNGIELTFGTF